MGSTVKPAKIVEVACSKFKVTKAMLSKFDWSSEPKAQPEEMWIQ